MWYDDIIKSVRSLVRDNEPEYSITNILYKHDCLYLLTLYTHHLSRQIDFEQYLITTATKERYKLFDNFTDVPYAVIKGAPLSKEIYGEASLRKTSDVDILVDKMDTDIVKSVLFNAGFTQGRVVGDKIVPFQRDELIYQAALTHQIAPFVKATDNKLCPYVKVDINTNIWWGESHRHADIKTLLSTKKKIDIYGININKLDIEEEFISLCMHHYKDMNSIFLLYTKKIRLNLFCDIFYFLKNLSPNKLRLYALAEKLEVRQYIHYCLYYTNLIFDDNIVRSYLDMFDNDKDTDLIDTYGLSEDERHTWGINFYERLFHKNLTKYLCSVLSQFDLEKINTNLTYM